LLLPRDELVRLLGARVLLYATSYDQSAVLAPEALALARALIGASPDASGDPQAVRTLAELFRYRALLLGDERGRKDAALAGALTRMADGPPAQPTPATAPATTPAVDTRRLAEALEAAHSEVDALPVGLPDRVNALVSLGQTYSLRFEWTGVLADLHQAIGVLRDAETAAGVSHPDRAHASSALGVACVCATSGPARWPTCRTPSPSAARPWRRRRTATSTRAGGG
jgi:hypothetical protein